jgi:hypothetical protein
MRAAVSASVTLTICLALAANLPEAQAGIIWQQDFSSTTLAGFTSATPNSGQVNEISASSGSDTSWAIASDDLVFTVNATTATAQVVGFTRSTDFSPIPTLVSAKIVARADSQGQFASDAVKLTFGNLGSTYNGGLQGSTAGKFGEIGIAYRGTASGIDRWSYRSGGTNAAASVMETTYATGYIFLNNTASAVTYTGPNNLTHTLAAQSYTVWQDTVVVGTESTARMGAADLSNFRLRYNPPGTAGSSVSIDELVIRDDLGAFAIPEPTTLGLAAIGAMVGLRRRR